MLKITLGPKALNHPNSDKPGAYKLASKLKESILNPGETLNLEQYVTGYGSNSGFKIVCYISNNVFDEENSYLHTELSQQKNALKWGEKKIKVDNGGFSLTPSSMQNENWEKPEFIFDTKESANYIITEKSLINAPFTYKLKTHRNAKAGAHYIVFYLTYFNGSEWMCEEERVSFKINNTFERFNTLLSILAAAALIVTIAHDGIAPLFDKLHEIGKFVSLFRSSR
ncbi:hypothetical protein [Pseudomonas sp. BF-R-24]|uniref:hypothetical protein n=1 Tax=Pseudomonas sp. BF-R-24 TaxID=2832386 RepID=UPI001CC18471|nr:hypothetical protein [Pseudomonas sp. BF-R-24]